MENVSVNMKNLEKFHEKFHDSMESFGVFVGGTSMEKPDPTKVAAPTKFVADIVDHEHQVVPRPSEKNVALRRHPNANQKKEKLRR